MKVKVLCFVVGALGLAACFSLGLAQDFTVPATAYVPAVPTSSASPGKEGDYTMDDNYIYTYHNNAWKKSIRANF